MTQESQYLGLGLTRFKDGRVMCAICFEYKTPKELAVDADGQRWDVCKGKCASDSGLVEVAEAS